jgi:PAS domain S-box-containing protein
VFENRLLEPRQLLKLLETAVGQAKEAVLITSARLDPPGPQILFVNPAFSEMTGYSQEEVLDKTPRILQGPKSDRAMLQRLREALGRGEPFSGETINYRKDGGEYYVEWDITPIRNSNRLSIDSKKCHGAKVSREPAQRIAFTSREKPQ